MDISPNNLWHDNKVNLNKLMFLVNFYMHFLIFIVTYQTLSEYYSIYFPLSLAFRHLYNDG